MWRKWVAFITMGAALLASTAVPAQQERVGLVLSGGGARGLAHVGVLHALEEMGIEVHAIAGTSMGAIVGALAASGRNAAEVEWVARNTDWGYAFTDKFPRTAQPYVFRQLDADLASDYRLNLGTGGVVLPRGVLQGQHLTQILDNLFAAQEELNSFDEMAIPYRAVAADLVTGKEVVLSSGRLSTAVRASMTIPGFIEPVEWQDMLLVDGGIVNNLPISVVQSMNVDRLIVVDVGSPSRTAEEIENIVGVMDQLSGHMVRGTSEKQKVLMHSKDVLVTPDLEGVSNMSFGQVDDALWQGYIATFAAFNAHAHWSAPKQMKRNYETQVDAKKHSLEEDGTSAPVISFVRVDNEGPVKKSVLRKMLRQKLGEPLDKEQLLQDISAMYGLDYYKHIRYQVVEENDRHGLLLEARERREGSTFLRMGMRVSDDFEGNSEYGLGASLRMAGLNELGGTAYFRGDIGTKPRIEARFVQPLDEHLNYFIEPQIRYYAEKIDVYDVSQQSEALARYRRKDRQAGLAFARQLYEQKGELRISTVRRRGNLAFMSGHKIGAIAENYDDGYFALGFGWDTLDDLAFPQEGNRWRGSWEFHRADLSANRNFQHFDVDATLARSWRRFTVMLEADVSVSDIDERNFATMAPIGGFLSLSGLALDSRWGQHKALVRSVVFARLGSKSILPVGVPTYAGFSLEQGDVWDRRRDIKFSDSTFAGSVFLGAKTPLGPAYLSFGRAEGGHTAVNLFLGQLFR